MRLLLDTHALLWFIEGDLSLSLKARQLIQDTTNEVLVSPASLWETAIKISIGKLDVKQPFDAFIAHEMTANDIELLPITIQHQDFRLRYSKRVTTVQILSF